MSEVAVVMSTTVFQRAPLARVRKFRGRLVVAYGSAAVELDEVAEYIFRQLDGARSVAGIGDLIATEFAVSASEATADATDLLTDLAGRGMVVPLGGASVDNGNTGER